MFAYMDEEALARSIETGEAWFYIRLRNALWKKGETSGNTLRIIEIRVDCDQDALLVMVEQNAKGVCHTGRASLLLSRGWAARAGRSPASLDAARRRQGV